MLATITFFVVFFTLWAFFHVKIKPRLKFARIINKLPGAASFPIIGNTYLFFGVPRQEIFTKITEYSKTYGPLCRNWIGSTPMIHVGKPDYFKIILKSSNITKGEIYNDLLPWLGQGILLSTGSKWHERRKLLTPALHFQNFENFIEIFLEKSQELISKLNDYVGGKIVDINPIINDCSLDIITEAAMNVKISEHSDYVTATSKLAELLVIRQLKPWLKILFLPFFSYGKQMRNSLSTVHNFTIKIIEERKAMLASNIRKIEDFFGKKRRESFLDILLETCDDIVRLSDRDVREEVDTFMFAGHHTTSASICWTLFLLGNNPDVQQHAYDEIKSVLKNKEKPNINDLNEMKYLECVIKESLRLYPSVPVIIRKLSEDIYLNGYHIPKNSQVVLQIYDVHRNPEFWDDPNMFDPTRFYPIHSQTRHPFSYLPFSAGQRNCIGQKFALYEMKAILVSILTKFILNSVDKIEDVKPVFEIVLKPSTGVRITLEKREV